MNMLEHWEIRVVSTLVSLHKSQVPSNKMQLSSNQKWMKSKCKVYVHYICSSVLNVNFFLHSRLQGTMYASIMCEWLIEMLLRSEGMIKVTRITQLQQSRTFSDIGLKPRLNQRSYFIVRANKPPNRAKHYSGFYLTCRVAAAAAAAAAGKWMDKQKWLGNVARCC